MHPKAKKILIVDDQLKNLQLTAQILREEGYLISLSQNGENALEILKNQTPDLILLDIMMPGLSGLDTCRRIKEDARLADIPVIFLTAKRESDDVIDGFNAGGVDYIVKPFRKQELIVRIKNHIDLADSRNKIIEMNKTRDKMYGIIAHDLRTPLSGITQTVDAIAEGYIDVNSNDFKEIFNQLRIRTTETTALLENLIDWSKSQTDAILASPKNNNIHYLIKDCVSLLSFKALEKDIEIVTDTSNRDMVYCDFDSIHAVCRNLLSNAIKFTPKGGKIFISTSMNDYKTVIRFKDTGTGIKQDVYNEIFVHNRSFSSTGTNNEMGVGLGMLLVKEFIANNNGTLKVETEVNRGSEFIITLPAKK
jgi:two-component system, sensor histidine kinase and response regulator